MLAEPDVLTLGTGGALLQENSLVLPGSAWALASGGVWQWYTPYGAALELYRYFPTFLRAQDADAGLDAAGEAVLEKLTWVLEKEGGAHSRMLTDLVASIDVDSCEPRFLNRLAWLLGEHVPDSWTPHRRRWFVRLLPDLLKLKGQHLNFTRRAAFRGVYDRWLVELFKSQLYEVGNYARAQSDGRPYRAARVDMLSCTASCETLCESSCEMGAEINGEWIGPTTAAAFLDELGDILPVHVRLRRNLVETVPRDRFHTSADTIGCASLCESICESVCESIAEDWLGSEVHATFRDRFPSTHGTFSWASYCVTVCQADCQTCCECGQEGTCSVGCEASCESICEDLCQIDCMVACQSSCQGGGCEWGCEAYPACETSCEPACQASCVYGIEP